MDEGSSSSSPPPSSSIHLGSISRSIDRHNPIIRDPTRRIAAKSLPPPSSSYPPPPPLPLPIIPPKPYNLLHLLLHKGRKCSSSNPNDQTNRSSAESSTSTHQKKKSSSADFMSRAGSSSSSRYLLSDMTFLDVLSDFDPFLELVQVDHSTNSQSVKPIESSASKPPSSSSSPPQVVVLRVSLHCKGCEGKVRKHISRMQGVTSFNIDFAAKKVTVVGDVTPLGVLASLSKVKKNAQLWTPAMSSSEIKETKRVGE